MDYNWNRPHSALGNMTLAAYAATPENQPGPHRNRHHKQGTSRRPLHGTPRSG